MSDDHDKLVAAALHAQTHALIVQRENDQLKCLAEALKQQVKSLQGVVAEYERLYAAKQAELEELRDQKSRNL